MHHSCVCPHSQGFHLHRFASWFPPPHPSIHFLFLREVLRRREGGGVRYAREFPTYCQRIYVLSMCESGLREPYHSFLAQIIWLFSYYHFLFLLDIFVVFMRYKIIYYHFVVYFPTKIYMNICLFNTF